MKQPGFFDVEERPARLSGLGDQLEAFSRTVDFEVFRPELNKAMAYSDGSKGGRPPFDAVLLFKILVIQTLNNLSDERTEYLINDRLSFMCFLGLELSERVPDAKTVWLFRQRLAQAGAIDGLFNRFDATLVALQSNSIPRLISGATPPIAQKPMRISWTSRALSQRFTEKTTSQAGAPSYPEIQCGQVRYPVLR
jgi:hypothetical protein